MFSVMKVSEGGSSLCAGGRLTIHVLADADDVVDCACPASTVVPKHRRSKKAKMRQRHVLLSPVHPNRRYAPIQPRLLAYPSQDTGSHHCTLSTTQCVDSCHRARRDPSYIYRLFPQHTHSYHRTPRAAHPDARPSNSYHPSPTRPAHRKHSSWDSSTSRSTSSARDFCVMTKSPHAPVGYRRPHGCNDVL